MATVAGEVSMTTLDIGGTNVTSTAAELNIMDGDTSAVSTTLADADRVVTNDNGTMKQVALTDVKTYLSSAGFSQEDPTALAIALGLVQIFLDKISETEYNYIKGKKKWQTRLKQLHLRLNLHLQVLPYVMYTVAGSTTTVVLGLVLANIHTAQVTATVRLVSDTGSRGGSNNVTNGTSIIVKDAPIPVGGSLGTTSR